MPIHDWTRVGPGIFHDFHQGWIVAIRAALNCGLLPRDHYALVEQKGAGFEPDVLALKTRIGNRGGGPAPEEGGGGGVAIVAPRTRVVAESDLAFYRRKQSVVAVRHASGDELVAIVEVVSPGNKSSRAALDDFVTKAFAFLEHQVHLLLIDLQPPTSRDPDGIHGALWDHVTGETYTRPPEKPLTLAAYEASTGLRAFVEPVAVGDPLPEMPLFLGPNRHVPVPLETTYQAAFDAIPARWRDVLTQT